MWQNHGDGLGTEPAGQPVLTLETVQIPIHRLIQFRSCLPVGSRARNPLQREPDQRKALLSPLAGARAQVTAIGEGDWTVKLFFAGDVMTGRGIDQILPHKSSPEIYEQWLRSARDYIVVAERVSGPIAREVDYSYI